MDLTDNFISMCAQAQEIQRLWKHEIGDFYRETIPRYDLIDNHLMRQEGEHENRISIVDEDFEFADSTVWLPRQDQLQKMIGVVCMQDLYYKITTLKEEKDVPFYAYNYYQDDHSIEQTLLRIVMKENFHKTWNGEDWV